VGRSTSPYFTPDANNEQGDAWVPRAGNQASYTDETAYASPLTNYYYIVLAVGAGEAKSPASNRVGAFHFTLTPGSP
jgi:hypothetical protein